MIKNKDCEIIVVKKIASVLQEGTTIEGNVQIASGTNSVRHYNRAQNNGRPSAFSHAFHPDGHSNQF